MVAETIIGGLVGGLFRVVPEVLKWMDRKDERKHELAMQDKAREFQSLLGTQRVEEANIDYDVAGLDALKEAIRGQSKPSGSKWVDGFSKLMRPLITFQWVILLYPAVIVATFVLAIQSGTHPWVALTQVFGDSEKAMVAGIVNFWFLDRVLQRR